MARNVDYGIDAPGVIRNLVIAGLGLIILGFIIPSIEYAGISIATKYVGIFYGATLIASALLMLLYSKSGKFFHRDRMLKMIDWKGNETVLDVGTGRGLLLIGAAKKLSSGKCFGVDIWNSSDLTHNNIDAVMHNIEQEGVRDKTEVLNQDIRKLSFPDQNFDVIVSNLCIHNIKDHEQRNVALMEMHRVLKPGGTILLSDYKNINEYETIFRKFDLEVQTFGPYFADTFPPLKVVKAVKACSDSDKI